MKPAVAVHPSLAGRLPERADVWIGVDDVADVAVLPWPERPHPLQAWVCWAERPEDAREALEHGADAILRDGGELAERVEEGRVRRDLRIRARAHAMLVEHAEDPMEVTDPEAVLLDVNPAWERATGIRRGDAVGRTPAELFRGDTHPASFYARVQDSLERGGVWTGTMIGSLPDGGLAFQAARIQHVRERDHTLGHVAIKRIADGLGPESPAGTDVLRVLASCAEALVVLDRQGRVVAVNPRGLALLGRRRAELIGRTFTAFELGVPLASLLPDPGSLARVDTTLLTAGGPLDVEIVATGATGGMRAFAVWVVRDITARKTTERQLVDARESAEEGSRAKSRFLANMSHELRTPLNIILGYTELIQETCEDPDVLGDLARVHQAGTHLLSLVGDVLDLARIESGKSELSPEELDLDELVEAVGEEVRPLVEGRGSRLEVVTVPVAVTLDRRRMRQVLLNLVGNASKFTNGVVRLELERSSTEVSVHVDDDGIGMTDEEQGRVFQSFTQANEDIKHQHGGTGLGLTISRSLVLQMGGRIELSSAKGRGTRFSVVLPLGGQDPRASARASQ